MSRGATAELSGEAVTPHESFNGITLAAVVTETVRGWRGGRGMLGGGGSCNCPSDGGLDPPGSKGGARGGMLHCEDKARRTR